MTKTYQSLRQELDAVLQELQQPDLDIATAAELYEKGLTLASQLRKQLVQIENKVTKLAEAAGQPS